MNLIIIKSSFILAFFIFTLTLNGQCIFLSGGSNASGISGSISYSIGQTAYSFTKDSKGSVSEGIQQSFDNYSIINPAQNPNIKFSIFPNPTSDYLNIKIDDFADWDMSYRLYDINGKSIVSNVIISTNTIINTSQIIPGTYILTIVNTDKEIKSYTVIKN